MKTEKLNQKALREVTQLEGSRSRIKHSHLTQGYALGFRQSSPLPPGENHKPLPSASSLVKNTWEGKTEDLGQLGSCLTLKDVDLHAFCLHPGLKAAKLIPRFALPPPILQMARRENS